MRRVRAWNSTYPHTNRIANEFVAMDSASATSQLDGFSVGCGRLPATWARMIVFLPAFGMSI